MAPIANYVDYEPAKIHDQGSTPTCVAHAFCTLLAEHVQANEGEDVQVEFDFLKIHEEMEKARTKKQLRIEYLASKAKNEGIRTKCGKLVKIGSYRRFNAFRSWKFIAEHLQDHRVGPMVYAVRRYEGHKLAPKDTDVIEMPTEEQFKKEKAIGHLMVLRGFDSRSQWLISQNSWGDEDSVKMIPFEVFKAITKYCYYIKDVTIEA